MKQLLIICCAIFLSSCSNTIKFETAAIYRAEASHIKVELSASGYILNGADLSENGIVEGIITSTTLSDTIFFEANEHQLLSLQTNSNTEANSNQKPISLFSYLEAINDTLYVENEIEELEQIIKAAAYGPKGTYVANQTDFIRVIQVNFKTKRVAAEKSKLSH